MIDLHVFDDLAHGGSYHAAGVGVFLTASDLDISDSRDTCESFAPVAKCYYVGQILDLGDLARGVIHQSQRQIVKRNARAVVLNDDFQSSAVIEPHAYSPRVRVKGIFNQLFNDGGRTLYDLASRDL